LAKIIPGDNVCVAHHHMAEDRLVGCSVQHPFSAPEFMLRVNHHVTRHPFWPHLRRDGLVVRVLSDICSSRAWHANPVRAELLGHDRVEDHLSVDFGSRDKALVSVSVFRSSRGFDPRERDQLARLAPHLEQAYTNARVAEASGILGDTAVLSEHVALMRITPEGIVEEADPRAHRLFPRWGKQAGTRPPAVLARWLDWSVALLNQGTLEHRLIPLRLDRGGDIVEFRLYRRYEEGGYWLGMRLIPRMQDGRTSHPVSRLTGRECDILRWVQVGKTNEEIAVVLGVSFHTVKAHLKNIYRKLGVHTRTEAALLLTKSVEPPTGG
jgi:DNA-binding CsgD family transcriptional regulator